MENNPKTLRCRYFDQQISEIDPPPPPPISQNTHNLGVAATSKKKKKIIIVTMPVLSEGGASWQSRANKCVHLWPTCFNISLQIGQFLYIGQI